MTINGCSNPNAILIFANSQLLADALLEISKHYDDNIIKGIASFLSGDAKYSIQEIATKISSKSETIFIYRGLGTKDKKSLILYAEILRSNMTDIRCAEGSNYVEEDYTVILPHSTTGSYVSGNFHSM